MTTINPKKRAIFLSITIFLLVLIVGAIIYMEKEHFYNKGKIKSLNSKEIPNKIIYLTKNKDITQIFEYNINTKQSTVLYSDEKLMNKIDEITYFDYASKIIIASVKKSPDALSSLVKINFPEKKDNNIIDAFPYTLAFTNSDGSFITGIINASADVKLVLKSNFDSLTQEIFSFQNEPKNIIYIRQINSWLIKIENENWKILKNNNITSIENTIDSSMKSYQNTYGLYNRDKTIYQINLKNNHENYFTLIENKPIDFYVKNKCIVYNYEITENEDALANSKLNCNGSEVNLELFADKFLDIIYEN